jgi:gas vesicle protein
MMASNLTQKVSHGVEELRDRAAETISADGESVFRAIKRLSERIDEAEDAIQGRLIDAETHLAEGLDDVASQRRRTTWPRRFFWLLVGASIVASVFVSAPERAKELRDKLQG